MFEISRDTMISEILSNAPEAMPVFQNLSLIHISEPTRH